MKKTNYFSHDSNSRNDEKLLAVRMRLGAEGYGVYFMLLERLREESDYMSIKDYNMIAFDLRVDSKTIKSVVEDFGLFVFTDDGKYFYSESFNRRMKLKDESKQKRSEAGKKGMKSRWQKDNDNNVIKTDNNVITKQEKIITSKVKESKVKEEITPIPPKGGDVYSFDDFWDDYDKKRGDKQKLVKKWNKLSDKEKVLIRDYIPKYKEAEPDKQYRRDPQTFLNNKSWNDEIIEKKHAGSKETKRNNPDADRLEWLANYAADAFKEQ